jgi:hypothetical protein
VVYDSDQFWFMGDRAGQLVGSGEYWMGRMRVVCCKIQSSEVVALPMSIEDRSSGPGEQD